MASSQAGFTQICVVRGTVAWPGLSEGAGQLQLWGCEMRNEYLIRAIQTAGSDMLVCELLIFNRRSYFQESKRTHCLNQNIIHKELVILFRKVKKNEKAPCLGAQEFELIFWIHINLIIERSVIEINRI